MTTNTATTKKQPSHIIYDVKQRDGGRAYWNKVGAAFENGDSSHSVLIDVLGRNEQRVLQLRAIDRAKRPIQEGADPKKQPTHELFFVEPTNNPQADYENDWLRVGVAFTNRDGSLSLVVDEGDRQGPKQRFQMRNPPPKEERRDGEAAPASSEQTPKRSRRASPTKNAA